MIKKIVKTIVFCFIVIIVSLIGFLIWISRTNKIQNKDNPVEYVIENPDKKAIVIYQKGRTDYPLEVADYIADKLSNDGYQVLVNHPGDFLPTDLSEYDLIMFGTPVYASTVSSVLETYIKSVTNFGDAKVIYYITGMRTGGEELDIIPETFSEIPITAIIKIDKSEFEQGLLSGQLDEILQKE